MKRREALELFASAALLGAAGGCRPAGRERAGSAKADSARQPPLAAMPVIFLAHGSPMLLDDAGWVGELRRWAGALPRPTAVLMLSAHWEAKPVTLGATRTVPLVHDFYNFPERYYRVTYPAPGAPELAQRLRALLGASAVADEPARGLDHGAYVPMVAMYPNADVPTLQVSLPSLDPRALFALGSALAPLRREGVLIVGSGFLTHNLRAMNMAAEASTPAWAAEFDAWSADVLARKDVDALLDYRSRAPGVQMALPTHEHLAPVVTATGAALGTGGSEVTFPITGFLAGSLTRRSVQFG
jgi:4,5-DOPA dioxygenase extradiol